MHSAPVLVSYDDRHRTASAEDLFRRAAFNWALSTQRLVEVSGTIGVNSKVAHTALADIEYARDLLEKLFVPSAVKSPLATEIKISADDVRAAVKGVVRRVKSAPVVVELGADEPHEHKRDCDHNTESNWAAYAAEALKDRPKKKPVDLTAPVYSKGGTMRWADIPCPSCRSKAHERCRNADDAFREKPHLARIAVVETP